MLKHTRFFYTDQYTRESILSQGSGHSKSLFNSLWGLAKSDLLTRVEGGERHRNWKGCAMAPEACHATIPLKPASAIRANPAFLEEDQASVFPFSASPVLLPQEYGTDSCGISTDNYGLVRKAKKTKRQQNWDRSRIHKSQLM